MIRSTTSTLGRYFIRSQSQKPSVFVGVSAAAVEVRVFAASRSCAPSRQIFIQQRQFFTGASALRVEPRVNLSIRKRKSYATYYIMSSRPVIMPVPKPRQVESQMSESDAITCDRKKQSAQETKPSDSMDIDTGHVESDGKKNGNGTECGRNKRNYVKREPESSADQQHEEMDVEEMLTPSHSPRPSVIQYCKSGTSQVGYLDDSSSAGSQSGSGYDSGSETSSTLVSDSTNQASDSDSDVVFLEEVRVDGDGGNKEKDSKTGNMTDKIVTGAGAPTTSASGTTTPTVTQSQSTPANTSASQGVQGQTAVSRPEGLIGVVQMTSQGSKIANQMIATERIRFAKTQGVAIVFLPECFDYISESMADNGQLAETIDGDLISHYKALALELKIWISLGGFHEKDKLLKSDGTPYIHNSHVIINDCGQIVQVYRKIHMFDMARPVDGVLLKESDHISPGHKIMPAVQTPVGAVGLGICYDLRFPEFASQLCAVGGVEILTYPSAFTVPTGEAHWKTLLRARAIENQAYVVAAAQVGVHNPRRESYGHAMVVDPWGRVLAEAEPGETLITAKISMAHVDNVRASMPVAKHRRPDAYALFNTKPNLERSYKIYLPHHARDDGFFWFGNIKVDGKMVFLESSYARAFVNRKCVVPGHVLVTTKEQCKRMADMRTEQRAELFEVVSKVQTYMEEIHGAKSSTIAIQDGADAGQTVEHLHVHILPRKPMDFPNNDDVYKELAKHDKGENIEWRKDEEMIAECKAIRRHIWKNHGHELTIVDHSTYGRHPTVEI